MQIHDPDDNVAPPPIEKRPTEFTATFSEEHNAELSNFETKKIPIKLNVSDSMDELIHELRKGIADTLHIHLVTVYLLTEDNKKIIHGMDVDVPMGAEELKYLVDSGKLTFNVQTEKPINDAQIEYLADEVEEEKSKPTWNNQLRDSHEYISTSGYVKQNMNPDTLSDARTDKDVNKLRASLDSMMEDVILNNEGLTDEELQKHLASLDKDAAGLNDKWSEHMESVRETVSGTISLALNSDQEFSGAEEPLDSIRGSTSLEPKTLKLLTASGSSGNMGGGGKGRYDLGLTDSMEADSLNLGTSNKSKLTMTGETAISDYDYGEDAFEEDTSIVDLDTTAKTVESDFTLPKSEEKSSSSVRKSRDGGGKKGEQKRDLAVKKKADSYEKAAKSPAPGDQSEAKSAGVSSIDKAKATTTPIASKSKAADSTYSKSSSMSNLSPFGTLAEDDLAGADTVQEFDLQEQSFTSNTNPADGSLALSESNDMSFVSM